MENSTLTFRQAQCLRAFFSAETHLRPRQTAAKLGIPVALFQAEMRAVLHCAALHFEPEHAPIIHMLTKKPKAQLLEKMFWKLRDDENTMADPFF